MSDWSSGYNVDLGYTYGYYREISPAWLNYAAALRGIAAPSGAWRYLELGCGQGVGLVLLAALHPDHEFVGIDFNPLHIAHARALAASAGLGNISFHEADFVELAAEWPSAWGKFDYVTAHGIYSWLAEPVRRGLVGTIDKATAPGALVYISYNALPGWISTFPVQHLFRLWQTSEALQSVKAISTGIERFRGLMEAGSAMTRLLPAIQGRIDQMEKLDRSYLVQEYLHDNWHPMWFDAVAAEMSAAKLVHVGTATVGDLYLAGVLPQPQKDQLARYDNPVVREVMIDVLVNQTFRRDVFARGNAPRWPAAQAEFLKATTFALAKRPENDEIKFRLSVGEVSGRAEVYVPLLDALAAGPKSLGALLNVTGPAQRTLAETVQAITLMLHAGMVTLWAPPLDKRPANALNKAITAAVAEGAPYRYLVAAETGAVLQADHTDIIMLHAVFADPQIMESDALAGKLIDGVIALGKGLVKDGQPLRDRVSMLPYARTLATAFLETTLPKWKAQGIA
ncbi:MAG: hypothetical protein B7Z40_14180 [Bosea sp. 12-68-7]|nr:MAG: hypothetical protein B7Z40_14180 [Bosea sp. 12-68-7]